MDVSMKGIIKMEKCKDWENIFGLMVSSMKDSGQ